MGDSPPRRRRIARLHVPQRFTALERHAPLAAASCRARAVASTATSPPRTHAASSLATAAPCALAGPASRRRSTGDGLERVGVDGDRRHRRAAAARRRAELRDGAGRRLRRGERDRRRPPAVSRPAGGAALRLQGRGGGHRGATACSIDALPRARQATLDPHYAGVAGRDRRHAARRQGRRHRRGRGGRGGDARRPHRTTAAAARSRRCSATTPGAWRPTPPTVRDRPGPVGRLRAPVPRPERRTTAHRPAQRR